MKTNRQSEHTRWMVFISFVGAITLGGYFLLYPQKLFKPGEQLFDFGYNLGLAGGVMMLVLLLYPLRKRYKPMSKMGALPGWFKWHMVLGILGPLIIIFHSTYHVYIPFIHPAGSPNAAVAMLCMLLVSGSGTFGRMFYTKIHHGLYGRQATLKDLQAEMAQTEDVQSMFSFAPNVEKTLEEYRLRSEKYGEESSYNFIQFIKVGFQASLLSRSLPKEVHQIMQAQANQFAYDAAQVKEMEAKYLDYQVKIRSYLDAVRDAAQFHTYERLFSWWHVFHIPLVYMMVFSAFYHVYAVHAY